MIHYIIYQKSRFDKHEHPKELTRDRTFFANVKKYTVQFEINVL